MKRTILTILILAAAGAAHAEDRNPPAPIVPSGPPRIVSPAQPAQTVVVPDGGEKGGPGTNATIVRSGTGAATVATDPAAGGNAEEPTRAVPLTGGGGGSGGGN